MKYCEPVFPGRRIGPIRFASHGLGNLLLVWARACVYARQHGHSLVWPAWSQLQIGSWLRWERDKRVYGRLFREPPRTSTPAHANAARRYSEKQIGEFESGSDGDAVLCFRGIEPGFEPLIGHSELLWRELGAMARDDLIAHQESARDFVGFGIRLGDFKTLGWATPMSWFEKRLRELRRQSPDQRVWIFSDGTDEELKTLLAYPWVARAPERRDVLGSFTLSAIAQISGTKAMVVTGGSSFHRWGVFLGRVPVLAHAVDEWHAPIWSRLSPCGLAVTGDQEPTAEDWVRVLNGGNRESAIR